MENNRATRIVELANTLNLDVIDTCYDVIDCMDDSSTELHRLIRASFSTDDDFDDMKHEIDHVIGNCSDDPNEFDCPWRDDEDDA